jgi:hypothetical protein
LKTNNGNHDGSVPAAKRGIMFPQSEVRCDASPIDFVAEQTAASRLNSPMPIRFTATYGLSRSPVIRSRLPSAARPSWFGELSSNALRIVKTNQ